MFKTVQSGLHYTHGSFKIYPTLKKQQQQQQNIHSLNILDQRNLKSCAFKISNNLGQSA